MICRRISVLAIGERFGEVMSSVIEKTAIDWRRWEN